MKITMTERIGKITAGWVDASCAGVEHAVSQRSRSIEHLDGVHWGLRLLSSSSLLLAALIVLAGPVYALESLDDSALSATTGQNGLTLDIKVPNDSVIVSQIGLVDTNGILGAHVNGVSFNNSASLVYSPLTYSMAKGGVSLCMEGAITDDGHASGCTATTGAMRFTLDAGAGSANDSSPTLNLGIALPVGATKLRFHPFSIYMATGNGNIYSSQRVLGSTNPALRAGVTEVLRMGGSYTNRIGGTTYNPSLAGMEVVFGSTPTANLQLGNERQGHMFMFTGGSLSRISNYVWNDSDYSIFTPLQLLSKNGSGQDSQISTFFDISGAINLAGFYMDVENSGLVFGKDGDTPKFDVVLARLQLGGSGAAASDGLRNQEMFYEAGARGVQMTDLKIKISSLP